MPGPDRTPPPVRRCLQLEAKDYELRRAKGKLATVSVAESRARNLQAVPHAYSADGKLRYGDTVQLCVPEEDGKGVVQSHYLANNIFEPVDAAARTVAVSATHMDSAVARNTFVIVRAPAKTHYEVRAVRLPCRVAVRAGRGP